MADSSEVFAELLKAWPGEWQCLGDFAFELYEPRFVHAEYLPRSTRRYLLRTRETEIYAQSWTEACSRLTQALENRARSHERELCGVRALLEHVKARRGT